MDMAEVTMMPMALPATLACMLPGAAGRANTFSAASSSSAVTWRAQGLRVQAPEGPAREGTLDR